MWKLLLVIFVACAASRAESDPSDEVARLKSDILTLEASVAKHQGTVTGLEGELSSCQAQVTQRDEQIEQLQHYKSQVATLTEQLKAASSAADSLPGLEARAAEAGRAAQQCAQKLASLEDAAKASAADCGSQAERVQQLTSELASATQAASECSATSKGLQDSAAAAFKQAEECRQRVDALEAESSSAKDGIAECEARIERQRPARQALELERSKLLDAEQSLTAQLEEVHRKLALVESHWLPLWLHSTYDWIAEAIQPAVQYYEEMIVTGKLHAQLKAKAIIAYGVASKSVSQYSKMAYSRASVVAKDVLQTKAGQEGLRLYHVATGHAHDAYAKVRGQVDKVLLHPEVQGKLQFLRNQLQRLEQDLIKLVLHALRSHPSVEPFAEKDIARAIALGLIYGTPGLVLLYLLCGCCFSQGSLRRQDGPEIAPLSRSVAKPATSSSAGRKAKGKGQHAPRV